MDILTEFHKKCGLFMEKRIGAIVLRNRGRIIREYPIGGAMSPHKIRQDADEYLIGIVNRGQRG